MFKMGSLKVKQKFLLCTLVFNLFFCKASSQELNHEVTLIERIDHVLNSHEVEELGLKVRRVYSETGGKLLVRLCSTDSYVKSLPFAKTPLGHIKNALRLGGVPNDRLIFSRSNKCGGEFEFNFELLLISAEMNLSDEQELFSPCQLILSNTKSSVELKKQLKSFRRKLYTSENKNKMLTILGVYIRNISNKLLDRLKTVKRTLAKEVKTGIAAVSTIQVNSSDIYYLDESDEPQMYYVEVAPNCSK